jgi:putative SOS response-associated peptidase YedK
MTRSLATLDAAVREHCPVIAPLRGMLKPYNAELMKSYEVSRVVNSVKNDTPTCIEPKP